MDHINKYIFKRQQHTIQYICIFTPKCFYTKPSQQQKTKQSRVFNWIPESVRAYYYFCYFEKTTYTNELWKAHSPNHTFVIADAFPQRIHHPYHKPFMYAHFDLIGIVQTQSCLQLMQQKRVRALKITENRQTWRCYGFTIYQTLHRITHK